MVIRGINECDPGLSCSEMMHMIVKFVLNCYEWREKLFRLSVCATCMSSCGMQSVSCV